MKYSLFSSESVCAGHPDKICDQISDGVLDLALELDKNSRVAVETLVTANRIVMAGEVCCPKKINFEKVARNKIKEIGYKDQNLGFWYKSPIEIYIHQQSADIAIGVDDGGAGDQGMMFGYAANETRELMPLPIVVAHKLCQKMDEVNLIEKWIRPDGKSQVTVKYENGIPVDIDKIVLARPLDYQHLSGEMEEYFFKLVNQVLVEYGFEITKNQFIFNGTGRWEIGGPASDTGVTGRKIVVDTYGGMGRIGGGCFSGKDPTKVDRSAAYAARFIAKNIVAAKLADRCEVQLAYAIGVDKPIQKAIETFGTEKKKLKIIEDFGWSLMSLTPKGIINKFNLKRPIYSKTAAYGHFGREGFPWEEIVR